MWAVLLRYRDVWSQFKMVMLVGMVIQNMDSGGTAEAARILGIFPTPSVSHQLPFQALMKLLVARGHHITVLSTDPLKEPLNNYTDVDLSFSYDTKKKIFTKIANMVNVDGITFIKTLAKALPIVLEEQFESSQMKHFIRVNENKTFDLVFIEWNAFYSYFGLIHALGSPPVIGIVSLGGVNSAYNDLWNPNHPAVNPELVYNYSDKMSFWQRIVNAFVNAWLTLYWEWSILPSQESMMREQFGKEPPPTKDARYNMSLLILNNHWTTDYSRAMLPNVVQIAGIHVKDHPGSLSQDLQQWMDDSAADGGVVYFSLGSNVLSKDLPPSKRTAILRAFARLPMKVLWKFEADELPRLPANVRVSKWLPQQAVLAHPNVRLFITQGGLQSFQEAVYHAVPLLGIPFFGDQYYNVVKFVAEGVGQWMTLSDLTEDTFYDHITSIMGDTRYYDNIRRLSNIFREHKNSSIEEVLWRIEHVLQHNGAPHLRTGAHHLPWYQYLLLDIVAVLLVIAVGFFYVLRRICCALHKVMISQKHKVGIFCRSSK